MPTTPQSTPEPGPQFIRATALARIGRYEEAMTALQAAFTEQECSEVQALDLKARIHAQQGYYLAAESCWERARKLDPDNPAYNRGLAQLRKPRRGTRFAFFLTAIAALLMAVLLLRAHFSIMPLQERQLAIAESANIATQNAIAALQKSVNANADSQTEMRRTLAEMGSQLAALRTSDAAREQQLIRSAETIAVRLTALETGLQKEIQSAMPRDSIKAIRTALESVEKRNQELTEQIEQLRKQSADQFEQILFFDF